MSRRKYTLEEKIRLVEELNSGLTNTQVCKKYGIASSTLSTFKKQLAVINTIEPEDYKATAKKKALELENKNLKELLGKKELELDLLQDLF